MWNRKELIKEEKQFMKSTVLFQLDSLLSAKLFRKKVWELNLLFKFFVVGMLAHPEFGVKILFTIK